ncbi:MAG: glutamate synthase subunit beta [Nitrospirae bacterium]|nr:glutamate synthase subunit beta [Candidatus Troglogloeales bacterium]MBI3598137.1 glutamate synthase subunit beta [Candidatus Troglogloeales bacterium]
MGDPRGFLKTQRDGPKRRPVPERVKDWKEFYEPLPDEMMMAQGGRCMDCGVPFCQGNTGCPVKNMIPDWNDLIFQGRWEAALKTLHATNNFPEFTGRLCPAPCETACVLGIIDGPVSIRNIEQQIVDKGFHEGWVVPARPGLETGKTVAVIGSGPAGLAAAQQLRRSGHTVVVFEKADKIGGLLRYGIPDFKMEKEVIDRRLQQMDAEGVIFKTNVTVGTDYSIVALQSEFDAILLATGAEVGRDLAIPGRELNGIHQAMDYLTQQNKRNAGDFIDPSLSVTAHNKRVVIIGGGDTGSDCLGTCHRQGAREVTQFELLPEPPMRRAAETPWPLWPMQLRTSHAHEEGCRREWSLSTARFEGSNEQLKKLHTVRVEKKVDLHGRIQFVEVPESAMELEADLVLLAMGFVGPEKKGLLSDLGVAFDSRGNVAVDENQMTSIAGIFAAGDVKRGASLIVWAIREGRDAADGIERYWKQKESV